MNNSILDVFLAIFAVLLVLILILAVAVGITYPFKSIGCSSRWSGTYETSFGITSGCRVNVDGKWMPERAVRNFGE